MAESSRPSSSGNPNPPKNTQHFPPPSVRSSSLAAPESSNRQTPQSQSSHIQNIEDSPIFKMISLLNGLRPNILEAIEAPDIQNCNAADEIREKMKLVMDQYREIISGPDPTTQSRMMPEEAHFTGSQASKCTTKPGEGETSQKLPDPTPLRMHSEDFHIPGTYIVGGSSVPGWNFVVYPGGDEPVYYGVTKAMHKSTTKAKAKASSSKPGETKETHQSAATKPKPKASSSKRGETQKSATKAKPRKPAWHVDVDKGVWYGVKEKDIQKH